MKDEIKEIKFIEYNGIEGYIELMKHDVEPLNNPECKSIELYYDGKDIKAVLDYITNLQEEVEDLRESNWAWHQTLKVQNKREYRSKFLKEFQQEYNTNTFPDYDEIYKRYDKVKKENERLIKLKERYQLEKEVYRQRIDKAIEYLEQPYRDDFDYSKAELLNILNGDDEE